MKAKTNNHRFVRECDEVRCVFCDSRPGAHYACDSDEQYYDPDFYRDEMKYEW